MNYRKFIPFVPIIGFIWVILIVIFGVFEIAILAIQKDRSLNTIEKYYSVIFETPVEYITTIFIQGISFDIILYYLGVLK